jgi:PleD family two-component response regulator
VVEYQQGEAMNDTLRRADKALYFGKTRSRNCIAVSQQEELTIVT